MSADRRKALIGRLVIGDRRSAVSTRDFAGIAEAAERAAAAPFAAKRMPGKRDRGKRSRPQFVRW